MKCIDRNCSNEMEHRVGKFGGFWYCPQHGTISDKGAAMFKKMQEHTKVQPSAPYLSNPENDPVMLQIERQSLEFGVKATELESWIVDDPDAADYEDEHWMNVRPY